MDLFKYDYKRVRVVVQDDTDRFSDSDNDPEFSRYYPYIHSLGDGNMEMIGIAFESPAD